MILGSAWGSIISPIAKIFGWILAAFYSFSHSYGWAIVLLTLTVMVIVFPLTRKGTRSMMRMQLLQPQLKVIQNRYKSSPGQTTEERQANRAKLNEEMMALYRENNVSPTGGCLPMFLQFPIFIVLYDVIRGMTSTTTVGTGASKHVVAQPQYIASTTSLYHNLIRDKGTMHAFGLNLADSVRTHQASWTAVIPYVVVILIAVALQYVSIWQITNRNPAASQANAQMQAAQKFMPLIFVFFYIVLPAGVGVYFIVSSAFRIGQQEWMYKHDKMITETLAKLKQQRAAQATKDKGAQGAPKGFFAKLRDAATTASANTTPALEAGGRDGQAAATPTGRKSRGTTGGGGGKASQAPRQRSPRPTNGTTPGARGAPAKSGGTSGGPARGATKGGSTTNGRSLPGDALDAKQGDNRSHQKRPRRPR